MLAAVLFYSILFFVLVVLPALVILLFLLFVDHERRFWRRVGPALGPKLKALWERPSVRRLRARQPRLLSFLARRLNPGDPWGLPATLAAGLAAIGIWFFAGLVQDLIGKDPLVTLDLRLHNSVALFRSPGMTWLMLAFTEVGSPVFLSIASLGCALIALSHKRRRLAATFIFSVLLTGILSMLLKAVFGLARPSDALIAVHEASFPSGHVLSGAVFYGLVASLVLRSDTRPLKRALATTAFLLLIALIAVSRLYLGVHWPSDILGSLALALVCLAVLLFFLHYDAPVPRIDDLPIPLGPKAVGRIGIGVLLLAIGAAAVLLRVTRIVRVAPPPPARAVSESNLLTVLPAGIQRRSEGLIGEPMEPVSLVFIGSSQEVIGTFSAAGWTKADLPTPVRVMKEGLAAMTNQPDPAGPATPAFLADRPQTLTFEKPDALAPGIRHRHHTRVWLTPYCAVPGCRPIWVATASFDAGVELSARLHLPTHRIDPHIDRERALIASDLSRAGATVLGAVGVVPPFSGTNAAGDAFSTDGRAVIFTMPRIPEQVLPRPTPASRP